ncbi:hypothetical protein DY000_02012068 [Brassica cretica]|uniref:Uncharacterized protein n=1 Tax=Brassica cretica TaxID=69181 RepID=A0ABQ7DC05_BRACR|nr:hypothetical protein DY000_02012068 [Brassica cretica]
MEKNVEDLKILAEQWFHQGVEFAQHIPKNQLYAAVGALLLTTIFLFSRRLFRRTKSNTVLLSRLSGSGKTVLFYQRFRQPWQMGRLRRLLRMISTLRP